MISSDGVEAMSVAFTSGVLVSAGSCGAGGAQDTKRSTRKVYTGHFIVVSHSCAMAAMSLDEAGMK